MPSLSETWPERPSSTFDRAVSMFMRVSTTSCAALRCCFGKGPVKIISPHHFRPICTTETTVSHRVVNERATHLFQDAVRDLSPQGISPNRPKFMQTAVCFPERFFI